LAHTVREQLGLFGLLLMSGPRGIGRCLRGVGSDSGRRTLARAARLAHWRIHLVG
jgi:hypothetical protein